MRFSVQQKRALLAWARDLGAPNVPSYAAMEQMKNTLKSDLGDATEKTTSAKGNVIYLNQLGLTIAMVIIFLSFTDQLLIEHVMFNVQKDVSNPELRPHMEFYCDEKDGKNISEAWQAEKLLSLDDKLRTPMVVQPLTKKHIYIHEIVRTSSGNYFYPKRWVKVEDQMWGVGYRVDYDEVSMILIFTGSDHFFNVALFLQMIAGLCGT